MEHSEGLVRCGGTWRMHQAASMKTRNVERRQRMTKKRKRSWRRIAVPANLCEWREKKQRERQREYCRGCQAARIVVVVV